MNQSRTLLATAALLSGYSVCTMAQVLPIEQQAPLSHEALLRDLEALTAEVAGTTPPRIVGLIGQPDDRRGGERHEPVSQLPLGSERAIILIDGSKYMLEGQPDSVAGRRSDNWSLALAIVDWLTVRMSPGASVDIVVFGEQARVLTTNDAASGQGRDGRIAAARGVLVDDVVPTGERNLEAALSAAVDLGTRRADIYLITAGLPTLSSRRGRGNSESAGLRHLRNATRSFRARSPVTVFLLPSDDAVSAASGYYEFALDTGGTLLFSSGSWP